MRASSSSAASPSRPTAGTTCAFGVVPPEYNHSFAASLKQAIDFAYDEWQAKRVAARRYVS
ncbi:NAD(P)H-dependent oxidoreductase [Micromonospora azadirachtae]|uniref:NAD(P)H-dependent oxidoreductase n=1 Tax=Micromonospora azadirachtae TaxID=1970735 RepID=A0ABW3A101_9ACTN